MTNYKDIIYNSLLIVFSVGLVISGAEVGLFFLSDDSPSENKWCEGPTDSYTFHPAYGHTMHPDQKFLTKSHPAQEWAWHTYNSEGFRDTYDSGDQTIVVVGDSFTRGNLADQNSTYPHLLDRWSTTTSFLNYGMGDYGTHQQLLVYRNVLEKQDHKMVIVGYYFGNDMKDNVDNSPRRPQFAVEDGRLMQTATPSTLTGGALEQFHDFLSKNTRTYTFISPQKYFFKLVSFLTGPSQTETGTNQINPKPPSGEELAQQRELTRHLLSAISTEARQQDAQVLIVGIPMRSEINPDNPARYQPADARIYSEVQRQMLRNVSSDSAHVEYLDLKPQLESEHNRGESVYGENDAHMNEYGYRITAQAIHGKLLADGIVRQNPGLNLSKDYDMERTRCPN